MGPELLPFDRAPEPLGTLVNARGLAGAADLVLALLLLALFAYRRRTYVLAWSAGWGLAAASTLALARPYASVHVGRAVVGLSQLLAILAGLAFVIGADSYRQRPHIARIHFLILLPLAIWFLMAPLALGVRAVIVPGHLIAAAALTAAAAAHGALLWRARLIGAGLSGGALLLLAAGHIWTATAVSRDLERWNLIEIRALFPLGVLTVLAAMGMQFLALEDMTVELRQTNRRLEKAQTELRHQVTTDPLTGCYNRRFFDGIIGRELKRHRRYGIPLSILFIDVDRFKAVNDTFGHEAGDRVLCAVAAFLARHVREADYLFRWGGDEFLILISCKEHDARHKGADLAEAFHSSREMAGLPPGVGLSVGYAEIPRKAVDATAAISLADERMYDEKERVRGRQSPV